ncbi:MAG: hemagglutinin, partial [Planctomycetota bacterium]
NVQLIGEFPPGTDSATTDFVTGNIAIDTAEAGVDYTAASGTLTFTAGSRQQQVRIPIIGDFIDESDKTVSLLFTNPVGLALSRSEVVGTILNDDSTASILVSISPTVFKVREDNSGSQQVPFVVTLIGKPADTVTVNYATADGTATAGSDYVPNTGSVTFTSADIASGIIQKLIFVTVKGDTNIEPDETFAITLELPSGSPAGVSINPDLAAGKVVIRNDDQAILTEVGDALALALSDDLTTILGNGPKSNPALLAALRTRALEIIRTQGLTKAIVIILDPVDFVLTDTQGRQSGYTEGTGVVNDIPGTYYSGDGAVELMIVPLPPDGTYNVQLAGLGGDFNASVTILDSNGTSTNILSQSLSDGATSSFSFQVGERATIPVGLGLAARAEAASAIGVVGAFGQFGLRLALAIGQDNAERNGLNLDDANTRNSEWMSWLSTTVRVARRELLEPLWQTLESPLGDLWATGLPLPDGIPAEFVDRFWSQVGQSLTGVPSGIYRLGDMLESLLPKPAPGQVNPTELPRPRP